jgi:hypothetical protein
MLDTAGRGKAGALGDEKTLTVVLPVVLLNPRARRSAFGLLSALLEANLKAAEMIFDRLWGKARRLSGELG